MQTILQAALFHWLRLIILCNLLLSEDKSF